MDNQQILEKAIKKAIDGGWRSPGKFIEYNPRVDTWTDGIVSFKIKGDTYFSTSLSVAYIIFNHDFAKALWGEAELKGLDAIIGENDPISGATRTHYWQYHIQMMVIADDPIEYLGKNI